MLQAGIKLNAAKMFLPNKTLLIFPKQIVHVFKGKIRHGKEVQTEGTHLINYQLNIVS